MIKFLKVFGIGAFFLLFLGVAHAQASACFLGTEWDGNITLIRTDGTTETLTDCDMVFENETGSFFSGTIEHCGDLTMDFSGYRVGEPDSGSDIILQIGAPNFAIVGTAKNFFIEHNVRSQAVVPVKARLTISGTNITDGTTFNGTLRFDAD